MTPIQKLLSLFIPIKRKATYNHRHDRPSNQTPSIDLMANAITSLESGNFGPFADMVKNMLTDDHVQTELSKRKLALLGDPFGFRPASKRPVDVAAAKWCQQWSDDYAEFTDAMLWLLDGVVWPHATMERHYKPGTNGRRFDLELHPVDPALFDYQTGALRIQEVAEDGSPTGCAVEPDPARFFSYKGHLSTLSPLRGGPAKGLLFWQLMRMCGAEWWARFLERLGAPFMVGKVSNMDSDETDKLEAAFAQATRLFGVVVSRDTEIEVIEAKASDGSRAYEAAHSICNQQISKILLGQYGTTDGVASGLNGDTASKLDKIRGEYRAWDNFRLGSGLRSSVIAPMMRVCGVAGAPPTPFWGDMGAEQNEVAGTFLESLAKIGILPAEEALEPLSEAAGIPLRWAPAGTPRTGRDGTDLGGEILHQLGADPFPFWLSPKR